MQSANKSEASQSQIRFESSSASATSSGKARKARQHNRARSDALQTIGEQDAAPTALDAAALGKRSASEYAFRPKREKSFATTAQEARATLAELNMSATDGESSQSRKRRRHADEAAAERGKSAPVSSSAKSASRRH